MIDKMTVSLEFIGKLSEILSEFRCGENKTRTIKKIIDLFVNLRGDNEQQTK